MLILTLRTDKPEAEVGLYDDSQQLAYHVWQAHRQLAETLHTTITEVLAAQEKTLADLEGIVCFQGPGSFTGLRIGLTVANTLAYSLSLPIVCCQDPHWLESGIEQLLRGEDTRIALPFYGADAHITPPKK